MSSKICRLLVLTAALLSVPAALASGFHVYEQGGKASGQAVAFIARADDASATFYNPAALANQDAGWKVDFGASAIFLGKTKLEDSQATTASANPLYWTTGLFTTAGNADMDDHTPTPIHVGIAYKFKDAPFAVSFGLTNPFGLITDWSSDPNFVGRYAAWRTDLRTFDYQLNGSMAFGGGWAGSVGIDYLYVDLRNFSKWLPVPASNPGIPGLSPYFIANTLQDLEGTGHKIGWNASLHYKNPQWSFGLTYRSKIDVEGKGKMTFTPINVIDPNLGDVLPANVVAAVQAGVAANLPSGGATATLRLPANYGVGIAYTGLPKWQFELDVHRIEWSHFNEVPVELETPIAVMTPLGPAVTNHLVVDESWKSTTSIRFGTSYDINDKNQLRAGVYTESNAIPTQTLRPSIPDGKRTGVSLGYGLHFGKLSFDLYYLHIFVEDRTVAVSDTTATTVNPSSIAPAVGLGYYGNAGELGRTGKYTSGIDLLGLTMGYKF